MRTPPPCGIWPDGFATIRLALGDPGVPARGGGGGGQIWGQTFAALSRDEDREARTGANEPQNGRTCFNLHRGVACRRLGATTAAAKQHEKQHGRKENDPRNE